MIVRLVGQPTDVTRILKGKITMQTVIIDYLICSLDKYADNDTRVYAWYPKKTKDLRVIVEFNGTNGSAWCDEIDLWIEVPEAWWYWPL